jgi:hypothetical protein
MINLSKNVPYIVAFPQGAAGRFVKYLLHSLLTNLPIELKVCPVTNSTHRTDDQLHGGYSPLFGEHRSDIWEILEFDPVIDPVNDLPRIFTTHQFPDFKRIKERLSTDVRIIIITVDPFDLPEVVVNDKVKNTYDLLTGQSQDPFDHTVNVFSNRYKRFLNKPFPGTFVLDDTIQIGKAMALDALPYFANKAAGIPLPPRGYYDYEERIENFVFVPDNIDYPEDKLLLLPYNELYKDWIWLRKLEEFTNRKAGPTIEASYQKYLDGRTSLVTKYCF